MSGPTVSCISLLFSGTMPPHSIQLIPVSQSGAPLCPIEEWESSDGNPADDYSMIAEFIKDDDTTYIFTTNDRTDAEARSFFSTIAPMIPAGAVIDKLKFSAYYKYHLYWDRIAIDYDLMSQASVIGYLPTNGIIYVNDLPCTLGCPEDGYLKLIVSMDGCTNNYSSPSELLKISQWGHYVPAQNPNESGYWYLLNPYRGFAWDMATNPATGLPWTLGNLNTIQFGLGGKTGSDDNYFSTPMGQYYGEPAHEEWFWESDVAVTSWSKAGGPFANYYDYLVDNEDVNYIYTSTLHVPCSFAIDSADYSMYAAWKNSEPQALTVNAWVAADWLDNTMKCRLICIHDGTKYYLNNEVVITGSPGAAYQLISVALTTKPWGGFFTSWTDIDPAHTSFGVEHTSTGHAGANMYLTKLSIDSVLIKSDTSELRVTQAFLELFYHLASPSACKLPQPETLNINQSFDTNAINFDSGTREVYGLGRNGKTLSISGTMWDGCTNGSDTCETIITCIRTLAKRQQKITLSGLYYTDYNTDYNILRFSWVQTSRYPNVYEWSLDLEFCD